MNKIIIVEHKILRTLIILATFLLGGNPVFGQPFGPQNSGRVVRVNPGPSYFDEKPVRKTTQRRDQEAGFVFGPQNSGRVVKVR